MNTLQFPDRFVSYDTFIHDVASKVVELMRQDLPERMSQREAYRRYGRGNVDRWRRKGLLQTYKRPGKVEYLTAELQRLQARSQDYFL